MTVWIIEPHDPLIVRDGKPFGPDPGARAKSLAFPFPSTTTGGIRTRAGLNKDTGVFEKQNISLVKTIKVKGPLLVQLKTNTTTSEIEKWLVPAPLDALLLDEDHEGKKQTIRRQLVPLQTENTYTNLSEDLYPVGLSKADLSKPNKKAPRYWYREAFEQWLLDPTLMHEKHVTLEDLGHNGPPYESRTHVSIDAEGLIGKEGALFQTSGLEFTITTDKRETRLDKAQRLALAVAVENNTELPVQGGLSGFGGERRVVSWRESKDGKDLLLSRCPDEIRKKIIDQKACRVILLTPAYFAEGFYPYQILQENGSVKPDLKAIATQRPQVVSGWDLEKGGPKPSRRLAPAGTVLFLELTGNNQAIENWIERVWMQCVSDKAEDGSDGFCNDGFGLAVLGTWSGKPVAME